VAIFSAEEYELDFFKENGYYRKKCPRCGDFFWTQDPTQELCGEANSYGCSEYTFIMNPPTKRRYGISEMRECFLSFFEKRGHTRIQPYPVVARWRDDLFFTHASIVDFQPYVTSGEVPPPANPLVISQPCLRFVDLDNVGPTFGRHLTIFEMGGHHAFNSPKETIYWKNETVSFHHEFVTDELGVKSEEVIYKEGVWSGGGNAGPCVESIVRGLELATLVFMKYKTVNGEFIELPIKTVDTGYGIERYTWLSQGTPSCFHSTYGPVLESIVAKASIDMPDEKILSRIGELSGLMDIERGKVRIKARKRVASELGLDYEELERLLKPIENIFTLTDHTKTIVFILAEGIVPSNMGEGYLARLIIRRIYRLLKELSLEDSILDIVNLQIDYWSRDFPYLKEMSAEINEILNVEVEKFKDTLSRGEALIKRLVKKFKAEGVSEIPKERLIELYDSHGLPPEIVRGFALKEGVQVQLPEDFYKIVAERHIQSAPSMKIEQEEISEDLISNLPETKRLYYDDRYLSEFVARVLKVINDKYVVLDATAFYPEGGGQPADRGYIEFEGSKVPVMDVQSLGNVIIHKIEGKPPKEGVKVRGIVDWEYRYRLMRNHTATHIILGAARRVLGMHVWQRGAQKGAERSRLDISHYRRLTPEETRKIELLANEAVMKDIPVDVKLMPREEAERLYGFRLYQGGVVPGRYIRVVKIGEWDVEACGGLHCSRTGEIGLIKIVHTERIQDGVERIVFSAGPAAIEGIEKTEEKLSTISSLIGAPMERIEEASKEVIEEVKVLRRKVRMLEGELARLMAKNYIEGARLIRDVSVVSDIISKLGPDLVINVANEVAKLNSKSIGIFIVVNRAARVIVRVGDEALKLGFNARDLADKAAKILGGRGSGRDTFAQGGGPLTNRAEDALKTVIESIMGGAEA